MSYFSPVAISAATSALRHWLLSAVGIALALGLVEVPALLRLVDYRNVTWLSPNRYDSELLTVRRPYIHLRGSELGGGAKTAFKIPRSEMALYQWDAKYDRNGFRNNTDLDHAEVVVVGSSFIEAVPIADAALMTTLLALETRSVVVNLGHNTFSPQQDLIALRRYGFPLRPRTIVWMFTSPSDVWAATSYRYAMPDPLGFWPAFFKRSFTRFAYAQLKPYLHPKLTPRADGTSRSGLVRDAEGKTIRIYFYLPALPTYSDALIALEDTRTALAGAYALGAAQGSRLLVVFIPESFRIFQPFANFPVDSECRRWTLNDEPQRLEAAVRSISPDIGYLDLTPVLRQAVSKGIIPYYTDDDHWSSEGHRLAAQAIGDYLSRVPNIQRNEVR